jgi:hypothetical protein
MGSRPAANPRYLNHFSATVHNEDELLPLLLGNERLIWPVVHLNASLNMPKRVRIYNLPDSSQRHVAAIPGIKLSHFIAVVECLGHER